MQNTGIKNIQHLFSRGGFGINYREASALAPVNKALDLLFKNSETFSSIEFSKEGIPSREEMKEMKKKSPEKRKELRKMATDKLQELNLSWLRKMAEDKAQLREKMVLFWHGHFACRTENPLLAFDLNEIQRKYALGKFRDLLLAVSKSPAMLSFLNNQQNRKAHPNENFARELMELFTIGRGNYTEQDIKESARAFTGWGFNPDTYEFEFREKQHDDGEKKFMGKTGSFNGEDIIDMILSRRETALFLCRKLYRFFVNDVPNEEKVKELADSFFASGYDIGLLMKQLFSSDWFYAKENTGTKIKSPVEFIVMLTRTFSVRYDDPKKLIMLQRGLGQTLFYPPNVAGWAGGRNWIDSSTLMLRLRVPSVILNAGVIDFEPKNDVPEEVMMKMREAEEKMKKNIQKQFKASPDWDKFIAGLTENPGEDELISALLLAELDNEKKNLLGNFSKEKIKETAVAIASLPEYQMM